MKSEKNNIIIRQAEMSDRDAVYSLWQACFHDTAAFADYYFASYFKENKVLMLEDEAELKAMLHLNPYKMSLGGRILDIYYIVGVATKAGYRHRGAMTQLLKKVFAMTYDAGMPFIYLMPANEAIYTPFQFAYIYAQQVEKKIVSLNIVTAADLKDLTMIRCRPVVAEEDRVVAAVVVNSYMKEHYDLFTWRDAHYFERLQLENRADGGELLMLYAGDEWIGYLSYAKEDAVEVREIYCRPEWRQQTADWLLDYFDYIEGEILTPMTEGLLENKKQSVHLLRPIIMGRIVHLENWMKILPMQYRTFSLVMEVEDCWIEENSGIWQWTVRDGNAEFCRVEQEPDIYIEIDALMQWLTGYWPFEELEASGRVTVYTDCREVLCRVPVLGKILINEIV